MRSLTLFILLCIAQNGIAQREWAPIGAIWHYSVPNWPLISFDKIQSAKDTIILDETCRVLTITVGETMVGQRSRFTYEENQKVYHYIPAFNKFGLLYDFSKEEGESWLTETDFGIFEVRVDSTTFIQVNDSIRKVQHVNDDGFGQFSGAIIEGIGHTQYMFPIPGLASPGFGPLRCYEDSTIGLFQYETPNQIAIPCDSIWNPLISEPEEMFPIGATWHYEWMTGVYPLRIVRYHTYEIVRDTMIQGKRCKIRRGANSEGFVFTEEDILYEEEGKVYRYFSDIDYFGLIYDYSLDAGEQYIGTLGWARDTISTAIVNIDSVSSILINQKVRKVQYLSNEGRWDFFGMSIEGIGNIYVGLFPQDGLDDSGAEILRCYKDSSLQLFQYVDYPCDTTWVERIDHLEEKIPSNINIFPNPTLDHITFQIQEEGSFASSLRIFNVEGKIIHQEQFLSPKRMHTLDTQKLTSGLYILEVELLSGEKYRKKIRRE